MLRLFAFLFLISSCAQEQSDQNDRSNTTNSPRQTTDDVFTPYVLQLNSLFSKAMGKNYQIKTPIKMVEKFDDPQTIARCMRYSSLGYDSRNYIEVSKEVFDSIAETSKHNWMVIVLAHEVGHCDFSLSHSYEGLIRRGSGQQRFNGLDRKVGYKWPLLRKSLMWPNISPSETELMTSLLDEYIKEIVDQTYFLSNTVETFKWDPDHLPTMGYAYRYNVYSSDGSILLRTFDWYEFISYLNNELSLTAQNPNTEYKLPDFKCGNL